MTVIRPNQSPSSPRARISNPWPAAGTSKPLPETPAYRHDFENSGAGGSTLPPPQQESFENERGRGLNTNRAQGSKDEEQDVASNLVSAAVQAPMPTTGPTTSHQGTMPLPPAIDANMNAGPPASTFTPASNNPFRQKDLTINTTAASYSGLGHQRPSNEAGGSPVSTALPSERTVAGDMSSPSSRIPERAPRLDWQDPRSPVDPSGFSGGYFTELQELQQGFINAGKPKTVEIGPQEAEVADQTRKSTLQATPPEIVEGPPVTIPSPQHLPHAGESNASRFVLSLSTCQLLCRLRFMLGRSVSDIFHRTILVSELNLIFCNIGTFHIRRLRYHLVRKASEMICFLLWTTIR